MLLYEVPKISSGVVEAIHSKFEEESEDESDKHKNIDHHYETYLSALAQLPGPDNTTGPGFQETAEWLLGDRISSKSNAVIYESRWSLHHLLTASDGDLRKIGIAFESDRLKILDAIRAFHLAPWRTMQTISLKPEGNNKKYKENITFQLETFSRLTQQLYIDAATVVWLRQRIPKRFGERERLRSSVKEAIETSKLLIKLLEGIQSRAEQLNKNLPRHPVDYIGPTGKKSRPLYKRIVLSSVFLVSVSLLCPIIESKLSNTAFSPLCRIPIKWCIILTWMLL